MCAWGKRSTNTSTEEEELNEFESVLLRDDLQHLIVLPMKSFTDAHVTILCKTMPSQLETLSASGHALSNESYKAFGATLVNNTNLRSLAFGNVSMGDDGLYAFVLDGMMMQKSSINKLSCLDLSYKGFTDASCGVLLQLLLKTTELQTLNLSRNSFCCSKVELLRNDDDDDDNTLVVLGTRDDDLQVDRKMKPSKNLLHTLIEQHSLNIIPRSHAFALTHFDVSDCCLDDDSDMVSILLPTILQHSIHLQSLDLSGNTTATWLPDILQSITSPEIHILRLSNCGIVTSASYIAFPATIQTLVLSNNAIEQELSVPPGVKELDISNNPIPNVSTLLQTLSVLQLETLDVSSIPNFTVSDALFILANTADRFPNLRSIRMYECNLGNDFRQIADVMFGNSTVETIDIAGNGAPAKDVEYLLQRMLEHYSSSSQNSTSALQCIVLGGNQNSVPSEALIQRIQQLQPNLDIARDRRNVMK